MEKEFIPYEQALALKELGFDEPCFGFYENEILKPTSYVNDFNNGTNHNVDFDNVFKIIKAPTFSQAFRWFREKGINSEFKKIEEGYTFHCFKNQDELSQSILKLFSEDRQNYVYKTYEEAELECLKKLIEIVKDGKK